MIDRAFAKVRNRSSGNAVYKARDDLKKFSYRMSRENLDYIENRLKFFICENLPEIKLWKIDIELLEKKYIDEMVKIDGQWKELQDFDDDRSFEFESFCKANLQMLLKVLKVYESHDEMFIKSAPCLNRLSLLYMKRKDYESCIEMCVLGLKHNLDIPQLTSRLKRSLKALKRAPTPEQKKLIELGEKI